MIKLICLKILNIIYTSDNFKTTYTINNNIFKKENDYMIISNIFKYKNNDAYIIFYFYLNNIPLKIIFQNNFTSSSASFVQRAIF